jgi:hypothetical protein
VPVDPTKKAIFDFIPPRLHDRVTNLNDFFRVLVFDLWVDNSDSRQAIFIASKGGFTALMIDNGHALGFDGAEWRMKDQPVRKCYPLLAIDRFLAPAASNEFESVIAAIVAIVENDLGDIRRTVRPEWLADDEVALGRVFDDLVRRSRRLPTMVADTVRYLGKEAASRERSFREITSL